MCVSRNVIAGSFVRGMFSFFFSNLNSFKWLFYFSMPPAMWDFLFYILVNTWLCLSFLVILMGLQWYLSGLIDISLLTNDVQHLFICLPFLCFIG